MQHEAVRRNMLGLVEKRAESLARKAREELAALRGEGINEEVGLDRAQDEEVKKSIEEMIQRLRVPVRKDAEAGEYEVQAGNMELRNAPSTRGGDDMHKSGTDSPVVPEPKARTATAIRAELSWELRNLVDRAVSEMEAYEAHATSVSSHYKQAMERRTTRFGGTMGSGLGSGNGSVGNGGGILKNRNEESPVDREAIRRMSTGMPFTGPAVMGSVPRTFENIEGVARRGNKRGE